MIGMSERSAVGGKQRGRERDRHRELYKYVHTDRYA
jgi:hypothetical protein